MARADLLVKLVKAGVNGDKVLFERVVESIISEEKTKQHKVVAEQLEDVLRSRSASKSQFVGQARSTTEEKLDSFLFRINPKKTLESVILSGANREIVDDLVQEHQRADLLRSYNLEPRNRILLAGSPGNGKTTLAEAISHSLMIPLFVIRYDGIIGSYLGETAARLKSMFEYIRTQECVLFFDEFDTIGKERGDIHETGEIKRVVSSLLLQIDRLPSYVVVVAATNHPELLDKAVWRRFQIRLELEKPTREMIEIWIRNFEQQLKYSLQHSPKLIAEKLQGLNFAEIEEFILDVQRKYILSLPEVDMKRIVDELLGKLPNKFEPQNAK